ncbi:MAG: hypothetical protein ACXVJT_18315, partial [Thermoanaerobaculia bacterium]
MKLVRLGIFLSISWFVLASAASAQTIRVRVMPPNRAQFLQFQRFDVRVEATADTGATVGDVKITLDGRDITSSGTFDSPS